MNGPYKPTDYTKLLKKVFGFIAAGLIVFAIGMALVTLVLQPIIWVTNMLGRISEMLDFNPEGSEEITDYREDLDELTKENHIAYRYSDMLACSMNEKYTHDIKGCAAFLQGDGTFDKSVDLGPAESFRLYSKEIDEYQGMIPDSAYEDIWIPTLYEMDHYKSIAKLAAVLPKRGRLQYNSVNLGAYREKIGYDNRLKKISEVFDRDSFATIPGMRHDRPDFIVSYQDSDGKILESKVVEVKWRGLNNFYDENGETDVVIALYQYQGIVYHHIEKNKNDRGVISKVIVVYPDYDERLVDIQENEITAIGLYPSQNICESFGYENLRKEVLLQTDEMNN